MSEQHIPSDLRYTSSHEWVREEDDGTFTVGITHYAQQLLGDLVFIELPEIETNIRAGDEASVVESVKAASDVYSPITGEVTDINDALSDTPSLVNRDPYGDGWLFRVRALDEGEWDELLEAPAYAALVEEGE